MRKLLAIISAIAMSAMLFSSVAFASETVARKTDAGTFVIGGSEEPSTLEPANAQLYTGWIFTSAIYDNLIKYDNETGEYVNVLAESVEFTTDTQLVIKLKSGIKFHDGSDLTADDVLFTLERLAASSRYATNYAAIDFENCKVVDDTTLEVNLLTPFPAILGFLAHPSAGIMSRAYFEAEGEEGLAQRPMGTGAFVFDSWTSGDRAVATKSSDYWDDSVDVAYDTLIVRFIPESTTRMIEFETGGIDAIMDLASADVDRINNSEVSGAVLYSIPGEKITRLEMLDTYEPFANPQVRLAVAHAIDIEGTVYAAYGNTAEYTTSVLPSDCKYYIEEPAYEYDPELAKQLLAEAGYPDGFTCQCSVASASSDAKAMEIIQAQLAEIGITVEITTTDITTSIVDMLNGVANFGVINGTVDSHDPDQALSNIKSESPFMISSTNDETLNGYLVAGATTADDETRAQAYTAAQDYLHENANSIPISVNIINYACLDYVDNFPVEASGFFDVKAVTFK